MRMIAKTTTGMTHLIQSGEADPLTVSHVLKANNAP